MNLPFFSFPQSFQENVTSLNTLDCNVLMFLTDTTQKYSVVSSTVTIVMLNVYEGVWLS